MNHIYRFFKSRLIIIHFFNQTSVAIFLKMMYIFHQNNRNRKFSVKKDNNNIEQMKVNLEVIEDSFRKHLFSQYNVHTTQYQQSWCGCTSLKIENLSETDLVRIDFITNQHPTNRLNPLQFKNYHTSSDKFSTPLDDSSFFCFDKISYCGLGCALIPFIPLGYVQD